MPAVTIPEPSALATIYGVELVAAGTWRLASGEETFTVRDMADAVAAYECPAVRNPVLKLGHAEPEPAAGIRWDGEPAVGWAGNLRLSDDGTVIVADYVGMPKWLADVLPSAYPDRSIEAVREFRCQLGHRHGFVITAVALLGVQEPGVGGGIKSLQDVAALYGATDATGPLIVATAGAHIRGAAPALPFLIVVP